MADNARYVRRRQQASGPFHDIMTRMTTKLLIIYCDQLSAWALGCYGGHEVATPHIDRLAAEGVRCSQFFTHTALCTPSRACFRTGRYPNQSGIYEGARALGDDQVTFAHQLQRAGYTTGYAGKWHLAGQRDSDRNWQPVNDFGWADNRFMYNHGHFKFIDDSGEEIVSHRKEIGDENTYGSDWLTTKTIDFLKGRAGADKPFAYMVSFPDPHQPYRAREPYRSMFPESAVHNPETFWQEDVPDFIAVHRAEKDFPMQAENRGDWNRDREATLRNVKANYCAMVKHLDDYVGRMLDELESQGILDETLVIFTTDHGDLMGEHGMTGKNFLYEPAYRIPMLLRCTGLLPAGHTVDAMISTVDFMPTLLDLLGAQPSGKEEGRSAAALLRGESQDWDDVVFTHPFGYERVACFTPDFELGFDYGGEPILFDRRNDPLQVHNLNGSAEHADLVESIRLKMEAHYALHCPHVNDWLPGQHGLESH
jgi:arylsulfatase A-like enzyme